MQAALRGGALELPWIPLSPSREFDIDLGVIGQYFSNGISYGLTTGAADTDTGALTAADVVGLALWYAWRRRSQSECGADLEVMVRNAQL